VALVVGVIGPIVLWKNTGRTISAERAGLAATLEAENERLRERLSFERGETDRAELRRILDELAEYLFALDQAVARANGVAAQRAG
jgi:DNA-binding PadR family transcriptional regulator